MHFTPQEKRLAGILLLFLLIGVTVKHYRRPQAANPAVEQTVRR